MPDPGAGVSSSLIPVSLSLFCLGPFGLLTPSKENNHAEMPLSKFHTNCESFQPHVIAPIGQLVIGNKPPGIDLIQDGQSPEGRFGPLSSVIPGLIAATIDWTWMCPQHDVKCFASSLSFLPDINSMNGV